MTHQPAVGLFVLLIVCAHLGFGIEPLQARGRFVDKKPAFAELADGCLAREVAKELGYKIQ